jgi:hypothetical protein
MVAQVRKKRELIDGAHMAATQKKGSELAKRRNSKEKAYSKKYTKGARADWADKGVVAHGGSAGQLGGQGWLGRILEK